MRLIAPCALGRRSARRAGGGALRRIRSSPGTAALAHTAKSLADNNKPPSASRTISMTGRIRTETSIWPVHLEPEDVMKASIAVIDDSEIMRDAMVHLLCSAGYGVEQYASATEFLTAADISQANCLVVDVELGDITGIEMVRELFDLGYSFPVIFMTGSPEEAFQRAGRALGCAAFLAKPFQPDEMLHAVDRAITHNPAAQVYRKCA